MSVESDGSLPHLDLAGARRVVAEHLAPTPLREVRIPVRGQADETLHLPVLFKLENRQETGSFKVRGALHLLASLDSSERARGVVACSSGNHGRAVAWAARLLEISATIHVPDWVDPSKAAAIEAEGATLRRSGASYDAAERAALHQVEAEGAVLAHPFDDPRVIAGQGTAAMEVLEERPEVRFWFVPLSGGGLVSGVARAAKWVQPSAEVTAVSAGRARVMARSVESGRPLEDENEEATLAEALSGGIGSPNRYTFPLVRALVDHHAHVTEDEIAEAIRFSYNILGETVEGGGVVALAALLAGKVDLPPPDAPPPVVLLSGGNIDPERLARVLETEG